MPIPSRLFGARLAVSVLASVTLALSVAVPSALPVAAATAKPAVPAGMPAGIEPLATYTPANSCNFTPKPGTVKLADLLKKTYPGTYYGIARACGPVPKSEHYDGRAVDWMNSVRTKTGAARGKAVVSWLLATDKAGNKYANARRLGVMYVIWNNKIWGAYNAGDGWRPYAGCAARPARSSDSACHRDHIHISLSWEGAMGRTSYWDKTVSRTDYGPCRPRDLNWAAPYSKVNTVRCRSYARVTAPAGASATRKTLATYSGMELRQGASGAGVKALQRSIKATPDGDFGAQTKAALKRWQTAHGISASGVVNATTWRALLKTVR